MRWFTAHRELGVALDIILASFHAGLIPGIAFTQISEIYEDMANSCVHETSLALNEILLSDPIAIEDANVLASFLGML